MDDTQARLARCFSAVFPSLSSEDVLKATTTNVKGWDSVASVTLFAMIEEEYGVEMDLQDLAEMVSFQRILAYLQRDAAGKAKQ
jgi:acyl carrier protein